MSGSRRLQLVITTTAAQAVVDQAAWYVAREGKQLADRWEASVLRCLQMLPKTALQGSPCGFRRPELSNLRRMAIPGFGRHWIFYEVRSADGVILVVHILHGARDVETQLSDQMPL